MIGLYGGSFDPVHIGHLRLAEDIREYFNLNKIIFIPTYISPLKSKSNAKPEDRLNMLKLATEYNPFFEIDDREIREKKVSYTIKTIMYYKSKLNYNPIFIVGSDAFLTLHKWKEYNVLLENTNFIVIGRGRDTLVILDEYLKSMFCKNIRLEKNINPFLAEVYFFNGRKIDISSTEIRNKIKRGIPITYLVPPNVENYIKERRLYID